jgi:hypothetical protein
MQRANFDLGNLLYAWCLLSVCVGSHALGVTMALRRLRRMAGASRGLWSWTWLFVRLAGWMILLHLLEITVWGLFYVGSVRCPICRPLCTSAR